MSFIRRASARAGAPLALVLLSFVAAATASTLAITAPGAGFLDADVGTRVAVDYSADEVALKIPPLSPEIIEATRRDRERFGSNNATPRPNGATPAQGGQPTPNPSTGGPIPTPTPFRTPTPGPTLPVPTLPVPTPTLPVPTPTLPPVPTLPPIPTLPPLPTLPPTPPLPPLPSLPPLP